MIGASHPPLHCLSLFIRAGVDDSDFRYSRTRKVVCCLDACEYVLASVLGFTREGGDTLLAALLLGDVTRDLRCAGNLALGIFDGRSLAELQMELAHANRVETIGQLTASITHEINQPLAAARSNLTAALNFLDRNPPDPVEVREALAFAVKDNDRASTVVRRIRALMQKAPKRIDSVKRERGGA